MGGIPEGFTGYALTLGLLCGISGFRLGWRTGNRIALPAIQALMGFLAFAWSWRFAGPAAAALAVGAWAAGTTAASLGTFRRDPARVDAQVLRAARYRRAMRAWLDSGTGFETRPLATARNHLCELAVYLLAAFVSANLLALALGAVLINFMNAWVASLLRAGHRPWVVRLLAWPPWSVLRVAGYVMLGAACAAPAAAYLGHPATVGGVADLLYGGFVAILADYGLKMVLSRAVGRALARTVDGNELN